MSLVYRDVNDGVYRCGFAGTQNPYEKAYRRLSTGSIGSGSDWWGMPV